MPRLTGLRRAAPGRVALELDGSPWRTVPDGVVLRAGLRAGVDLDRPALRRLRRELRRAEALARAGRALAHRDLSEEQLRRRLRARGVAEAVANETAGAFRRAGLVDDARLAHDRARALCERGWGDAAIAARLEEEWIGAELIASALAALPAEVERAERALAASRSAPRAAAMLVRKGFSEDAIEDALARWTRGAPAG